MVPPGPGWSGPTDSTGSPPLRGRRGCGVGRGESGGVVWSGSPPPWSPLRGRKRTQARRGGPRSSPGPRPTPERTPSGAPSGPLSRTPPPLNPVHPPDHPFPGIHQSRMEWPGLCSHVRSSPAQEGADQPNKIRESGRSIIVVEVLRPLSPLPLIWVRRPRLVPLHGRPHWARSSRQTTPPQPRPTDTPRQGCRLPKVRII